MKFMINLFVFCVIISIVFANETDVSTTSDVTTDVNITNVTSNDTTNNDVTNSDVTTSEQTTERVMTFQEYEKQFKSNVGSVVKKLLPFLLKGSAETQISGPCSASILKIIGGVRQLKEWAMRFIDATGKLPAGVLEGTSLALGDYDECLAVAVGRRDDVPRTPEDVAFRGQYCMLESHRAEPINRAIDDFTSGNLDSPIAKTKTFLNMFVRYKHLTNTTFKMGVCIPSKCTKEDLESIMSSESLAFAGKITVNYCHQQGQQHGKSIEQTFILCIFGFFICLSLVGTIADIFMRLRKDEEKEILKSEPPNYARLIVKNTSLYSNALAVLDTRRSQESLPCLRGVRVFVVLITIYAHTYVHLHALHFQKFSKAANFLRFFESFSFSGIANSSVIVDTMVFIAAVTISYNIWRYASEKGKVNLNLVKLLLNRYFRMAGCQLLVICLFLVSPIFGDGPLWEPYMNDNLSNCRKRWWMNLVFINNFILSTDTCLYHTWLFALLMQLTLLGAIFVWILKKSRKFGFFVMILATLSGVIGVGVMTVLHELPGSMAFFMLDIRTFTIVWRDMYQLPYDHVGPFCIGLLTGYFLALKKDRIDVSRTTSAVLWCASIACNSAVMFGLYAYRHGEPIDLSLATFYAIVHRNVWALGVGWMVIACTTHHGGPVSRFLKCGFFVPLDRLCYMAYTLHMPIMFVHGGIARERWFMGHTELLFLGMGYATVSFALSFLLHITFVQPYFAIEQHAAHFFGTREKFCFEDKKDPKTSDLPSTIIPVHENNGNNGCVHLAYSKKTDGV